MQRTQHPSNNAVLGAPPGTDIEVCNALPITRIQFDDGTPAVESWWKPNNQERYLIELGYPVKLTILGTTHAPVKVEVDGTPI